MSGSGGEDYRKSSTLNLEPSMMLFSVPIGIGLLPCSATIYLPAIGMSPFLMTALLSDFDEAVAAQHANHILRVANGKALAH